MKIENTFFTSDTHFFDEMVLKLSRKDFKSMKEHNETIIKNWNKVVGENDLVFHLGDLGNKRYKKEIKEIMMKLNGRKYLLKGNHDSLKDEEYLDIGFDKVYSHPIFLNSQIVVSHIPLPFDTKYYINIHGHLHVSKLSNNNYLNVSQDVNFYKPVKIEHFIKRVSNLKKLENEKFGKEWYQEYYKKI